MQLERLRILLIEDDEEDALITRELIKEIETWRIDLDWVCDYDAATEAIGRGGYDVYLVDYKLGERDGLEVIRHAVSVGCHAPKILLTTYDVRDVDMAASQSGATDFMPKGSFDSCHLERTIRYALEQKRTEDTLEQINAELQQKNQELYRLALGIESAGEAMAMTDIDGNIEYINPAFTQLTGYSASEVIGKNPRVLQGGHHAQAFYTRMWQAILAGETWTGQITNRRKDESVYEAQLTIAPVKDGNDQIQGFVAIHNNITPLKEAQAALEDANKALQKKNKKLTELTETAHRFVDNVAHDFRTPLTVIKEFSSIIADGLGGPVTEQQTEYLDFITTATRDLAQMVDDFLDSSKLRARVLRVDRRPVQVDQIFNGARSMLWTRAAANKIRLVEKIPSDLPLVFADVEKVKRIIINLTVNAIKFSQPDSDIELWAAVTDTQDVRIGITDYGPGLAPHDLAVIFERFKQVGDVQRASTKGFGLGLNIAKELIWLNLGTVSVESERGRGSTFSFTLPPCVHGIILERYFQRLAELDEPPISMGVLQISPVEATADVEEVRRFVASVCYPMDLVMTTPAGDSVLALGSTTDMDLWMQRLKAVRESKIKENPKQNLSPLRIHRLAYLPYQEIKADVTSSVLAQLTELRACG